MQSCCCDVGGHDIEDRIQIAFARFPYCLRHRQRADPLAPCRRSDEQAADDCGCLDAQALTPAPQARCRVPRLATRQADMTNDPPVRFRYPGREQRRL